jgi:TonB family protein
MNMTARWGLALSVLLHVAGLLLVLWLPERAAWQGPSSGPAEPVLLLQTPLQQTEPTPTAPTALTALSPPKPLQRPAMAPLPIPPLPAVPEAEPPRPLATAEAPPAPSAEDWAFASRYTLKNSKAYRYTWGQQVRSMMGSVTEGPEQGLVRFRVEIAADGRLTRLQTLWSTSDTAEQRARRAISSLPQWPPTPNGLPLVFERTIAFTPHAVDGPPLYRHDCEPDKPEHGNPFAWDGRSAPAGGTPRSPPTAAPAPDPAALEDCLRQLPRDSIDAEAAQDRRLMERWGWGQPPR